jgi:hypothetical protein
MKKTTIILLFLLLMTLSLYSSQWTCNSDSDCAQGMVCSDELCRMEAGKFSTYATVEFKIGESSPSSGGSSNIITPQPVTDLILGQFEITATQNGADAKLFLIREIEAIVASSTKMISGSNYKFIYDVNGNGKFDSSDKVISNGEIKDNGKVGFLVNQKHASYKMNTPHKFIITGDFEYDGTVDSIKPFGLELNPQENFDLRNEDQVFIITNQKVVFDRYAFEPEQNYFIFTAGEFFPKPPQWKEMNSKNNIMHLRLKSIDGANEISAITIRTTNVSAKFGKNIKSVSLYLDQNGDGSGNELITEKVFNSDDEFNAALIEIPAGKLSFQSGEEKRITVVADMFLYNGQIVQFSINDKEPKLKSPMNFAGLPVTTDVYRYSCDESDPLCNVLEEEVEEVYEGDGGCSVTNL